MEITCHTGGAKGSDIIFENYCLAHGIKVNSYSFEGHSSLSKNPIILSKEELEKADPYLEKANKSLKRRIPWELYIKNLLRRNYYQIKDVNTVFAIGKIENNLKTVKGGTGWAVQMAIDKKTPFVWVFDIEPGYKWFMYNYNVKHFIPWDVLAQPYLSNNFAGIGTRELEPHHEIEIFQLIDKIVEMYGKI